MYEEKRLAWRKEGQFKPAYEVKGDGSIRKLAEFDGTFWRCLGSFNENELCGGWFAQYADDNAVFYNYWLAYAESLRRKQRHGKA